MESNYKSCRYNGKRMRQHRAVFLSIVEKFFFTKAERDDTDLCPILNKIAEQCLEDTGVA